MSTENLPEDVYEYRVIEPEEDLERTLNDLGEEGWRVVATVSGTERQRLVLCRPDPEPEVRIDSEDV